MGDRVSSKKGWNICAGMTKKDYINLVKEQAAQHVEDIRAFNKQDRAKDAEIAALRAENERLRAVLKPFVAAYRSAGASDGDTFTYEMPSADKFIAARAALQELK